MVKRLLGVLSYVGMLLVFGALAVRFLKPEWDQVRRSTRHGPVSRSSVLYTLGQWREIAAHFQQRNARYGALAGVGVLVVLGILVAVNYLSDAPEHAVGSHGQPAVQPVRADGEAGAGPEGPGQVHRVRPGGELRPIPAPARELRVQLQSGAGRVHRRRSATRISATAAERRHHPDGRHRVHGPHRACHDRLRAGPDQRPDQAAQPDQAEGLLPERTWREGSGELRTHGLQRHRRCPEARQLPVRQAGTRADERDSRRRHDDRRRRAHARTFSSRKCRSSRSTSPRRPASCS